MPTPTRRDRRAARVLKPDEHALLTLIVMLLDDATQRVAGIPFSANRFKAAKKLVEELRELHS